MSKVHTQDLSFNGGQKPSGGTIQQTFDTEPGQAYEVGFVLGRAGNGKGELSMECTLFSENGNLLRRTNVVAPPNLGWGGTNQIFFVATGPQATIIFRDTSLTTDSADVLLDAVHITALPRPTINLYAGVTLTGGIGRKYRVEYIDALGDGIWKELIDVTLSTSPQIVFDEGSPGHAYRFYRITLLE